MDRALMISQLEDYWHEQQKKNPEESMDIPGAVEFYRTISIEELLQEYNTLIG